LNFLTLQTLLTPKVILILSLIAKTMYCRDYTCHYQPTPNTKTQIHTFNLCCTLWKLNNGQWTRQRLCISYCLRLFMLIQRPVWTVCMVLAFCPKPESLTNDRNTKVSGNFFLQMYVT
jgi:hypothetical protein